MNVEVLPSITAKDWSVNKKGSKNKIVFLHMKDPYYH